MGKENKHAYAQPIQGPTQTLTKRLLLPRRGSPNTYETSKPRASSTYISSLVETLTFWGATAPIGAPEPTFAAT